MPEPKVTDGMPDIEKLLGGAPMAFGRDAAGHAPRQTAARYALAQVDAMIAMADGAGLDRIAHSLRRARREAERALPGRPPVN